MSDYKYPYIESRPLFFRLRAIDEFIEDQLFVQEHHQGLVINGEILIAKHKPLVRPLGVLDWAYYTPKGLAESINADSFMEYYEEMLKNKMSPANKWKSNEKEKEMKDYYSSRRGK